MESGALMISPFVRRRETDHGVYSSTCAICTKMVALSTDTGILAIAEEAHNCRNGHAKFGDQDLIRESFGERLPETRGRPRK